MYLPVQATCRLLMVHRRWRMPACRLGTWLQCRCFRVTGRLGGRRRILSFDVSVFGLKALEFRVEFWAEVR